MRSPPPVSVSITKIEMAKDVNIRSDWIQTLSTAFSAANQIQEHSKTSTSELPRNYGIMKDLKDLAEG